MTQVFGEDGNRISVTVVEAGPCTVVGVRTGSPTGTMRSSWASRSEPKKARVTKPMAGHYKKAGLGHPDEDPARRSACRRRRTCRRISSGRR